LKDQHPNVTAVPVGAPANRRHEVQVLEYIMSFHSSEDARATKGIQNVYRRRFRFSGPHYSSGYVFSINDRPTWRNLRYWV
jgi:hypothetical protein